MRNPDINKVYYLEHLIKKQRKKLFKNVGIEHSKYMIKKSKYFLAFIDGSWGIYDFNKGFKPTTNAEELFYTLENVQVDCTDETKERIDELFEVVRSKDFQTRLDALTNEGKYVFFRKEFTGHKFGILEHYDEFKTITFEKFIELFSERFPEVGQTKEENEKKSNQLPDDSKLVENHIEQDLEMIDKKPSLLQEAEQIINGSRAEDYGSVTENFEKIAKGWEMIFSKGEFTPRNVANAMIWLKICRDTNTPKYDNPLDIAGYAGCIGKMINEDESKR